MGKFWQGPHDDRWYLYDDLKGVTKLVHRWRDDYEKGTIYCPDCDSPLMFKNYKAKYPKCDEEFKSGWGQVYRVKPFAFHQKKSGCGWKSLRPYTGSN